MADLILPDSRLEAPELFYPGRKPVGRVKLDETHPLFSRIVSCMAGGVELTERHPLAMNNGAKIKRGNVDCSGTSTSHADWSKNISPKEIPFVLIVAGISLSQSVRDRVFYTSVNSNYYGTGITIATNGAVEVTNGDGTGATSGSRRSFVSTATLPVGKRYSFAFRCDSNTTGKMIVNSANSSFTTSGTASSYVAGTDNGATGRILSAGTYYYSDSSLEVSVVIDGGVSDELLFNLERNPYQFLIPA